MLDDLVGIRQTNDKRSRLSINISKPNQVLIHNRLHLPETIHQYFLRNRHKVFKIFPCIVIDLFKICCILVKFCFRKVFKSISGFADYPICNFLNTFRKAYFHIHHVCKLLIDLFKAILFIEFLIVWRIILHAK
ncbi:hypothetical protein D3C80_1426600 [compost metagenome]